MGDAAGRFLAGARVGFRFILQGRLTFRILRNCEVFVAMTLRLIASAALATLLLANGAQSWEPLRSGPQVGSKNNRNGFFPRHVAGPAAGQRLCPV